MESKDPLVIAFAGPSGHGKTRMARHMGDLLSVDMTAIDCAQMENDVGLFRSTAGYHRSEEGSQLNIFLPSTTENVPLFSWTNSTKLTKDWPLPPSSLRLGQMQNPPSKFRLSRPPPTINRLST